MNINQRIFSKLDEKGFKLKELADFLGVNQSVVSTWKKRGNSPSSDFIHQICDFLDISIEYLITGKESTRDNNTVFSDEELETLTAISTLNRKQQTIIKGKLFEYEELNNSKNKAKIKETTTPLKIAEPKQTSIIEEIIPIEKIILPIYSQRASAGIGKYMLEDYECEEQEFDIDHRTKKADHAIIVDGNSMYPTIEDGDYIFIREQQTIEHNEVGVFVYEDNVYCKRLHIDYKKKQLTLLSDNEDYPDIPIKNIDNLRTIGKVIL